MDDAKAKYRLFSCLDDSKSEMQNLSITVHDIIAACRKQKRDKAA